MSRPLRHRASGFTLIEVLAAVAVGALLLVLLSQSLSLVQDGLARARHIGAAMAQEDDVEQVLRGLLEQALPPIEGHSASVLRGDAAFVDFTSLPPQSRMAAGPLRVRLTVEAEAAARYRLVLTLAPSIGAAAPAGPEDRRVLLTGLRSASLAYLYAKEGRLQDSAVDARQLPELFVVRWNASDDPQHQAELAVRPRVHATGHCALDLTTATCRAY